MIRPNELRIGNLVSYKGNPYKITDGCDIEDKYEDCSPIELTPEILEKAGFVKRGVLFIHPSTMNFEIWNRAKLEGVYRWYAGREQKDCFLGISNEIKYLHQLQNLYFALTGEELKIDL